MSILVKRTVVSDFLFGKFLVSGSGIYKAPITLRVKRTTRIYFTKKGIPTTVKHRDASNTGTDLTGYWIWGSNADPDKNHWFKYIHAPLKCKIYGMYTV
jgi:hypothetical protein